MPSTTLSLLNLPSSFTQLLLTPRQDKDATSSEQCGHDLQSAVAIINLMHRMTSASTEEQQSCRSHTMRKAYEKAIDTCLWEASDLEDDSPSSFDLKLLVEENMLDNMANELFQHNTLSIHDNRDKAREIRKTQDLRRVIGELRVYDQVVLKGRLRELESDDGTESEREEEQDDEKLSEYQRPEDGSKRSLLTFTRESIVESMSTSNRVPSSWTDSMQYNIGALIIPKDY
ncbi:MAG: hypothetical protein Q9170_005350 [Blastenia crenularia]